MKISVKVSGKVFTEDLSFPVESPELPQIQNALCSIPGKFAHWMYLEAQAKAKVASIQQRLEETRARIYLQLSKEETSNGKKRTVEELKNGVKTHEEVRKLEREMASAEQTLEAVKAARTILQYYKDCVIELARSCRAEAEVLNQRSVRHDVRRAVEQGMRMKGQNA